jgi:phosphosulfolactate phosphohydrolase-like enzyme
MEQDRATLREILREVDELMSQARKDYKDLVELKSHLKALHKQHKVSDMEFSIRTEHIRRLGQQHDFCMRRLQRQKTVALQKLSELE